MARLGGLLLALCLLWVGPAAAQTERVKQLIVTDGQGSVLKMPSMTTAERNASSHNNGESIFCSDCSPAGVYFFFAGTWHESGSGGTGGAPTDATYITQTPNGTLTNEQALSSLGTGLMLNATGTGILSIYTGASCPANQGITGLTASGGATCASIGGVAPGSALAGVVTITGTATTGTVTFGVAQADTTYVITLGTRALSGSPPEVVATYFNKTTAGFDVRITAPPGAGNSVEVNWGLSQPGTNPLVGPTGPAGAPGSNYRICTIIIGADGGRELLNGDLGPQRKQCHAPLAGTVLEVTVAADAGTPNVIVAKRHCTVAPCTTGANETVTNLVSAALAAGPGTACAKVGATSGFDTFTTCSATLQNTALAAGDFVELVSGTAGGVAKRMTIGITWSEP